MCVSVFLGYVCECVYGRDLTPGSVIVFICDSRPSTQRGLTLQSFPTVYFWKTKLSFVFPQIRPTRIWLAVRLQYSSLLPFGCAYKLR